MVDPRPTPAEPGPAPEGEERITERPSWPPRPGAVRPDQAQAVTEAFVRRDDARRSDLGLDYAPTTADDVALTVAGGDFFPRLIADIDAAQRSVHVLEFGVKPGRAAELFERSAVAAMDRGVELRMVVDGYGSDPRGESRELFDRLVAAGAQIVVNDPFPLDRDGLIGDQQIDWRHDDLGVADHRKMFVVDGRVGWVGGAGIEDQFLDGRFLDTFTRVTGDVVRQLQAVFLTSFHVFGGPLESSPGALTGFFPSPDRPGTVPVTVLQNIKGSTGAGTQALRAALDDARRSVDVLNYIVIDDDMIDRIGSAAARGAQVRMVVSGTSNSPVYDHAFTHDLPGLTERGVQVWKHPAVVHAKVLVADDLTIAGTINLDPWALHRNSEIALRFDSADIAAQARSTWFQPALDVAVQARPATGLWKRTRNWAVATFSYFL